jgi:hypothetical protein
VLLNELGFDAFFDKFRTQFLSPIFRKLYPEFVDEQVGLDSHKAFVVAYKMDEDVSLNYHFDNSEVTLNVSLGKEFDNGELYFGPLATEQNIDHDNYNYIRMIK